MGMNFFGNYFNFEKSSPGSRIIDYLNVSVFLFVSLALFVSQLSGSSSFSFSTNILVLFEIFLILILLLYANRKSQSLVFIVAISLYAFFYIRLIAYAFFLEWIYVPVYNVEFSSADFDESLPHIFGFTLLFLLGLILGEARKFKPSNFVTPSATRLNIIAWSYFMATIAITLLIYGDSSQSILVVKIQEPRNLPIWLTLIEVLSSSDLGVFLICLIAIREIVRLDRVVSIWLLSASAGVAIYVGVSSYLGSTGSGLRLAMFIAAVYFLYRNHNFSALYSTVTLAGMALLINIAMLTVSFETRISASVSREVVELEIKESDIPLDALPGWEKSATLIANRLGVLDFPVVVKSREPDEVCFNRYHNFDHISKNIANLLLPGIPFKENYLDTSNTLGLCYGDTPHISPIHYHSQPWTLFGLSYRWWGDWYLIAALIAGSTVGVIYSIMSVIPSFGIFFKAYFAAIGPNLVFFMMGFDHAIKTAISLSIPAFFLLAIILFFHLLVPRPIR